MEDAPLPAALQSTHNGLNACIPIAKLPAEILEEVFKICVSWFYGTKKPKHRLAWTQVCCSWRLISLSSSRLWQRIDLCDPRLAEVFLVRSKQAPLSVFSGTPVRLSANNLAPYAHRLQSIDLCLCPNDMVEVFSGVGGHLSSLNAISLKIPPVSHVIHLDVSFPQVRHLSVDGVAINWDQCQNLVELNIRNLPPAFCPSIPQVQGIFRRSPNLKHVRLEALVTPCLEATCESKLPIYLLNVEDMVISGPQASIAALLTTLKLGPQSRLRLYTSCSNDIFPHGLPQASSTNGDVIRIPTVRLSPHGLRLLYDGTKAWSEEPSRMLLSISAAQMPNIYNSLCALVDASCVTKLELNSGVLYSIPFKDLINLFANLGNLETLCTALNDLEELCTVLQMSLPTTASASSLSLSPISSSCSFKINYGSNSNSNSVQPLYVPRLRNLSFSKSADRWWNFKDRWLTTIAACLKYRQSRSYPVHTIEFLRCQGISTTSTKELADFVSQVVITEDIGTGSLF
ncbi:hypothetical protein JR316_0002997 [Psilocybe cubensis]|uniref:F-box domain-containing protein n=2 Tax=Psilocybe cubensis TaxID=181762 RepID=A0A8H7Y4R0_PSICU|nr:hypothetical protein JR316_0002997 [Psilocybe cubensis]KAH9483529.1 hypothetical protein JR316_0002997 [Psilocybe cubensis]